MTEVARGEQMCQDGSDPVDAALCFYKALKVYPQPRELINIYDKTVPKVITSIRPPRQSITCSPLHSTAHPRHPRRNDRRRQQHKGFWCRRGYKRRVIARHNNLHIPTNSFLYRLMPVLSPPFCTYTSRFGTSKYCKLSIFQNRSSSGFYTSL